MMRVAVFGASGFVGATLVERLWRSGDAEVVPIIHSSGGAARLARYGRPLVMADALQPDTVARAIQGCTHVVNCSRGPAEVMLRGLGNLLDESRQAGIQRFVHISSVAAYGDPDVSMLEESAPARPMPRTYGWTKHRQDQMIEKAAERSLSCVVLCPPNISGCYSPVVIDMVDTIRRGELALIDGGEAPYELIDVENLVHAIRLALGAPDTGPERIFVTDGGTATWASVAAALLPLADRATPLPSVPLDAARRAWGRDGGAAPSLSGAFRHLFSSELRGALRKDPWLAAAEKSVKASIKKAPPLERALRKRFQGGKGAPRGTAGPRYSARLMQQQLRNIRYSQERARKVLSYTPIVSAEESMSAFRHWYRDVCGWSGPSWALARCLHE